MKPNSIFNWIGICLLMLAVTTLPTTGSHAQEIIDGVGDKNTVAVTVKNSLAEMTGTKLLDEDVDFYTELQDLLQAAPTRQVGQQGNDVVDQMIHDRFQEVVHQNNPTNQAIVGKRDELVNKADALFDEYINVAGKIQLAESNILEDVRTVRYPWYIHYTIDKPTVVVVFLFLIAILTLSAWYVQRRSELFIVGHWLWATAVAMIIGAVIFDYVNSDTPGEGEILTLDNLQDYASELAEQVLDADYKASNELCKWWQSGRITHPTAVFVPGKANIRQKI